MSNILQRANAIVHERSEEKDRQYGPFIECMERATALYNLMAPGHEITTECMYKALAALKLSREAHAHKEDNLLDAVAYLGALQDYWDHMDAENRAKIEMMAAEINRATAPY